jgi:phosphohistidine phosphatase
MKAILFLHTALSYTQPLSDAAIRMPITRKSQTDALRLATVIQARELFPDLILTSPALRARQTVEIICRHSGYDGNVLTEESLYTADHTALLELIGHLPNTLSRVMIVTHTPALKKLLNLLTGWDKSFPLNALAYLVLPIHTWREILELEAEAVLVELWSPSQPGSSYFMGFYDVG